MASPFSVRGSVGQVSVTGPSDTPVRLLDADGATVAEGALDAFGDRLTLGDLGVTDNLKGLGGLVLRKVEPGPYTVEVGDPAERFEVAVLDPWVLPDDFDERVRGQRFGAGYGYVEVRDGALLGTHVFLPDAATWGDGPYPTLMQYSGYRDTRSDFAVGDPSLDNVLNTEANLALLLGYAIVGVSLRGSGGSEGSFLLFEPIQGTDGHDVIEAIAAQPWVARKRDGSPQVAMIGRSMPGYSQLLVASFQPPSLAAITPAAAGGRPYGAAGRPGGIPNVALARGIAGWQVDPIEPPNGVPQQQPPRYEPGGWDDWVAERIADGDEVCERNQLLRGQAVDAVPAWTDADHEEGGTLEHADGEAWARSITTPTLVLGAWQDQESGPWFADLLDEFPDTTVVRLAAYNGTHEETRFPQAATRALEFLGFFVREELPVWNDEAQRYLDWVAGHLFPEGVPVSFDRWAGLDFEEAFAAYLDSPPLVVAFDNGAAPDHPAGYPYTAFSVGFDRWPPGEATAQRWYLGTGNRLERAAPTEEGRPLGFHYDPSVRPRTAAGDGFDANAASPAYDWRPPEGGRGLQFATLPLSHDLLLVGPSSLDLWLRASAPDVDIEIVLSEVRPDGWETYVQSGWVRASSRALDADRSTELAPRLSYRTADVAPLPAGEFSLVRVPIAAAGHFLRAGSRLGVTITAPGGNQAHWDLHPRYPEGVDEHGAKVVVELSGDPTQASSLVIPAVSSWSVLEGRPVADLPPLGALRRQPFRRWRPDGLEVPVEPEPEPEPEPREPIVARARQMVPEGLPGRLEALSERRRAMTSRAATEVKGFPLRLKQVLARQWVLAMRRLGLPPRVGLAAVVGLLAAGVGLALVRFLRHKS